MAQHESRLVRPNLSDIAPNNSDKASRGEAPKAEERKRVEPIVRGRTIKKKRSTFDKFKEAFLGESENLRDYILYDVLVPSFRDTISDMGVGIIERLFGDGRSRTRRGGGVVRDRGRSYISYNTISNDNRRTRDRDDRRDLDRVSRARHDFYNIAFESRGEAEDVLAHLVEYALEYGEVTVRYFYELSNIEADYTDDRYGWTNLRDAYVDRTRDGHVINFPPVRAL